MLTGACMPRPAMSYMSSEQNQSVSQVSNAQNEDSKQQLKYFGTAQPMNINIQHRSFTGQVITYLCEILYKNVK